MSEKPEPDIGRRSAARILARRLPLAVAALAFGGSSYAAAGDCEGIDDPHAYNYCLAAQGPAYAGGKRTRADRRAPPVNGPEAPRAAFPDPIAPSASEPPVSGFLNMGAGKPPRRTLGGRFLN